MREFTAAPEREREEKSRDDRKLSRGLTEQTEKGGPGNNGRADPDSNKGRRVRPPNHG